MTSFFWPNQGAVQPELNSRIGPGIVNKVLGINRGLRNSVRGAEHSPDRNGSPHAIRFLDLSYHMRFSSPQRHSNGKPDSLKGGAYVLAFDSVVTQKFLTPAPGTDRTNFLAVPDSRTNP